MDLPSSTPLTSIPAPELQRLAIRAIRLEANWRNSAPRVKNVTALLHNSGGTYVDYMGMAPGGKWLWTAQRREIRGPAVYTRVSLWSLEKIGQGRCIWTESIPWIVRTCTLQIDETRGIAAMHLALHNIERSE